MSFNTVNNTFFGKMNLYDAIDLIEFEGTPSSDDLITFAKKHHGDFQIRRENLPKLFRKKQFGDVLHIYHRGGFLFSKLEKQGKNFFYIHLIDEPTYGSVSAGDDPTILNNLTFIFIKDQLYWLDLIRSSYNQKFQSERLIDETFKVTFPPFRWHRRYLLTIYCSYEYTFCARPLLSIAEHYELEKFLVETFGESHDWKIHYSSVSFKKEADAALFCLLRQDLT